MLRSPVFPAIPAKPVRVGPVARCHGRFASVTVPALGLLLQFQLRIPFGAHCVCVRHHIPAVVIIAVANISRNSRLDNSGAGWPMRHLRPVPIGAGGTNVGTTSRAAFRLALRLAFLRCCLRVIASGVVAGI